MVSTPSLGLREKFNGWRADRAWSTWTSHATKGADCLVFLQYEDGLVAMKPGQYDAKNSCYWVDVAGEEIPIHISEEGDSMMLDGLPVAFAYKGLNGITSMRSAGVAREVADSVESADVFLHRSDLEQLQQAGPIPEGSVATDGGDRVYDLGDVELRGVEDVASETSRARQEGRQPRVSFDEDGYVVDSDGDKVLKVDGVEVPESSTVRFDELARLPRWDLDSPAMTKQVEENAVTAQNHPDAQGSGNVGDIAKVVTGAFLAIIASEVAKSGGGGGGGSAAAGGGGGGGGVGVLPGMMVDGFGMLGDVAMMAAGVIV